MPLLLLPGAWSTEGGVPKLGGGVLPLKTASSAISATTTELGPADVFRMTVAGTTLTISSADITEGRTLIVRAVNASVGTPVTVATEGSETIDGAVSILLTTNFSSVTLQVVDGNLESIA